LVDSSLVERSAGGRYTFHDLLREYATQLTSEYDTLRPRSRATLRLRDYYLHTARNAAAKLHPLAAPIDLGPVPTNVTLREFNGYRDAWNWFEAEHKAIASLVQSAATEGRGTLGGSCRRCFRTTFDGRGIGTNGHSWRKLHLQLR
jgi:hypothetical protein